jgi:hypothetical protein
MWQNSRLPSGGCGETIGRLKIPSVGHAMSYFLKTPTRLSAHQSPRVFAVLRNAALSVSNLFHPGSLSTAVPVVLLNPSMLLPSSLVPLLIDLLDSAHLPHSGS